VQATFAAHRGKVWFALKDLCAEFGEASTAKIAQRARVGETTARKYLEEFAESPRFGKVVIAYRDPGGTRWAFRRTRKSRRRYSRNY
jgi:response regulator of citrate/malate metabolism